MKVHWTRTQLAYNEEQEVRLCPHDEIARPWVLSPSVVHQKRVLWEPGPSIRECCIKRAEGLAIAAWWWEAELRFQELLTQGLPDAHTTQVLQWQARDIMLLLEEMVPRPTKGKLQQYIYYREDLGLTRTVPTPPAIKQLGLEWPCTKEDLDKRWRKLAQTTHPDRGGNPQEFTAYTQAYLVAKKAFESHP
jgi:hypothetical protein